MRKQSSADFAALDYFARWFALTGRSVFAGVLCGEIFMLAGKWWLG